MARLLKFICMVAVAGFFPAIASAATLYVSLEKENFAIGDELIANIKTDSEGVGINAAQATLQFPKDILEAVEVSKNKSVFNFWLEEPQFSNEQGQLSFIGGSVSGFSGKSLQILEVKFKVKGSGQAELVFLDGAITASDGSGTNVLSSMKGAQLNSAPKTELTPLTKPQQIIRIPSSVKGLPAKPVLEVALYPDSEQWYNLVSSFSAKWRLPDDVTSVATLLNNNPSATPFKEEGLFDNKNFGFLDDGIWYLHARFKNNLGWGPVDHYRIAIDTAPPLAFEIHSSEGLATDYPNPTLSYATGDQLSGLENYFIRIDNAETVKTDQSFYVLPLQAPSRHLIKVTAKDKAGNFTENSVELEIFPIESPIIDSVSREVIFDEENILIRGVALPNQVVKLAFKKRNGVVTMEKEVVVNEAEKWEAQFEQPIRPGKYFVEAKAVDQRGAQSLVVVSESVLVKQKPLLTIAGLDITQFWFFTILINLLVIAGSLGFFSHHLWRKQLRRKIVVAERDIATVFNLIKNDLDNLLRNYGDKKIDEREAAEMETLLKKLKIDIEKMKKYVSENIEEIGD